MTTGVRAWQPEEASSWVLRPGNDSHKYSRGVLGLRTGSASYPGAAVLGAEAAWRTGIGLVRFFSARAETAPGSGLPSPAAAVLAARPETVFVHGDSAEHAPCDAWVIGSGTDPADRSSVEREALLGLLAEDAPVVVDAGALDLVLESPPRATTVITPHSGEFRRVWSAAGLPPATADAGAASVLAERLGVTVLLKGSITVAASPGGMVFSHGPSTPWLATAGTGDVLAGVLGALVATHAPAVGQDTRILAKLAITAALLHDRAARIAAEDDEALGVGRPITALDVARQIPTAIARLAA